MADRFNAQAWLVGRQTSAGNGDRVAVRGRSVLTYSELDSLAAAAAAGLRGLGLRRADRVVFVMSDDVPLFAGILGAFRAGFTAVPVSTMLGASDIAVVLADCGASAVFASPEFADTVRAALGIAAASGAAPRHAVVDAQQPLSGLPTGVATWTWDGLIASGTGASEAERAVADTAEDDWALWLYTSGTTGTPKAAMHRHANIRHVCETYGAQVLGITADDICLSAAKLFFAYGLGNSMLFPLSVGAATVLEPRRPSPAVFGERSAQERPTLFFGVPTFYAALLASDLPDDAFASVRLGTSAGEPLPAALQERFTARFGFEIIDGIGSTEELHIFLSNRPGSIRPGTTGVPVPGYDIELRDPDGSPVPAGEPGALHVRGASMALGYWRRTDASRTVFQGEWLNTGDTYVRDADGYYTCLGRTNDLLKPGGIWVSPAEVESRLLAHSAVAEAAVVAAPDAEGLDKLVACVVLQNGLTALTPGDLVQWCRDSLAHFKCPRAVVFLEELPKTATGKVQRFKLRQHVAELGVVRDRG